MWCLGNFKQAAIFFLSSSALLYVIFFHTHCSHSVFIRRCRTGRQILSCYPALLWDFPEYYRPRCRSDFNWIATPGERESGVLFVSYWWICPIYTRTVSCSSLMSIITCSGNRFWLSMPPKTWCVGVLEIERCHLHLHLIVLKLTEPPGPDYRLCWTVVHILLANKDISECITFNKSYNCLDYLFYWDLFSSCYNSGESDACL